jgi:hypothetical protein
VSAKPGWRERIFPSDAHGAERMALEDARRLFILLSITTVATDLGFAAWFLFGPVEMIAPMRWLIVGVLLVSAPLSVLMLRFVLLRAVVTTSPK